MYIVKVVDSFGNSAALAVKNTTPVMCGGAIQVALSLTATDADTLSAAQFQVSDLAAPDPATAGNWQSGVAGSNITVSGTIAATAMNGGAGGIQQLAGSSSSSAPLISWRWCRWQLTVGAAQVDALTATTKVTFGKRPEVLSVSASGLGL